MDTDRIPHAELRESIIGAATKVLTVLQPGLDEKAHENAMAFALCIRGYPCNLW